MDHPLADRAIAQASFSQALDWRNTNPNEIRRPEGSSLHKLIEDWQAGIVVMPESAAPFTQLAGRMILGQPQVFLIEHDWAGAIGASVGFQTMEYRLPFDLCAFEFDISGHRVIHIEGHGMGSVVAVHSLRHWCTFPISDSYVPPSERVAGLEGIFQITAENIRALSAVLETGAVGMNRTDAPPALNKSRSRSGKIPVSDHWVIDLSRRQRSSAADSSVPGGGEGKRLHFRRGHLRRLNDGRQTWIRWTMVGNPQLGFINKHYKL